MIPIWLRFCGRGGLELVVTKWLRWQRGEGSAHFIGYAVFGQPLRVWEVRGKVQGDYLIFIRKPNASKILSQNIMHLKVMH